MNEPVGIAGLSSRTGRGFLGRRKPASFSRFERDILPKRYDRNWRRSKDSVLAAWRERAAQNVVSHPAAHGQRALWFLHQSHPESCRLQRGIFGPRSFGD